MNNIIARLVSGLPASLDPAHSGRTTGLVSLIAISVALAGPVAAQQADSSRGMTARALDEIVVTAQRRAESLEDVPISITTITSDALSGSGVTRVSELPQMVPGLRLDQSGTFAQPTIRGVGSSVAGPGLSTNVGTYVDGFYVPNSLTSDLQFLSVSNVQVLKGPQGTLFGRNATGGAILVTTLDPSYETDARFSASYGRFNKTDFGFYGSTGITDNLAVNFAGFYQRGDGWKRSLIDGVNEAEYEKYAIRTKVLFEPSDNARLVLGYSRQWGDDPTHTAKNSYEGLSAGSPIPGALTPSERGEVANNYLTQSIVKGESVFLTGEFDLGSTLLKSHTQYRDEYTFIANDNDSSSESVVHSNYEAFDKSFSQELTLSSQDDGRLQWLLGAYYFYNDIKYPSVNVSIFGGPFNKIQGSVNTINAYAGFADATYQVTDRLFVTGGFRYSVEEAELVLDLPASGPPRGQETWKSATPRVVVRYELADRTSVYASYTKGFKSGQLPAGTNRVAPVDPETIDAFEIGFKTARANMRLDLAAFYYDYKDLQVTAFLSPGSIVRNAASAEIYGLEAQLAADITDRFSVSVGGAYMNAEYDEFPEAVGYVQGGGGFFSVFDVDASGFRMQRAPKFSGNANATYSQPLFDGMLTLNANLYYSSKVYFDQVEQFFQNGYALLNLRATWTDPSDQWSFSAFGTNVTDKAYRNQVQPAAGAVQQGYGEPAVYGVGAMFRF
ncbi:MAG: TonB-dependent receptor [Sphingomonadales bacterium]